MKKLMIVIIATLIASGSVYAQAAHSSEDAIKDETSVVETASTPAVEEATEAEADKEVISQMATIEQKNANGSYDDKYSCDLTKWQSDYEYWVECWLGIKTNPLVDGRYGIHPERTEEWWDEWRDEMLSLGKMDQSWYDEMVEKGYIIEVD